MTIIIELAIGRYELIYQFASICDVNAKTGTTLDFDLACVFNVAAYVAGEQISAIQVACARDVD